MICSFFPQTLKIEFEINSGGTLCLLSKDAKMEIPIYTHQKSIEIDIADDWGDEYGVKFTVQLITNDLFLVDNFYYERKPFPEEQIFLG